MALGVGLIGTGFMGKCHALAWARSAVCSAMCRRRGSSCLRHAGERAAAMAGQFGFARATADWRALVADPGVDLVSITTPNRLHREMALAAMAAGKHVWCEKPLALTLGEAEEMAAAAAGAGVTTIVGYNYLRNPAFDHAKRLVTGGDRPVRAFPGCGGRGLPGRSGAGLDLAGAAGGGGAGHAGRPGLPPGQPGVGLMGPVESLVAGDGDCDATRPLPDGCGAGAVENEDIASALVRFQGGVTGVLMSSR